MSEWSLLGHPTNGWFAQVANGTGWVMDNTLGRVFPSFVGDGTEITATAVGHWSDAPYAPPVYENAERVMTRGLPANATPQQRAQASADAHTANFEAQQAAADQQAAAVEIATLPTWYLTAGSTACAGRSALIRIPARLAIGTATVGAVDLPARETASLAFNMASPGVRPRESLGSMMVNLASPGTLQPNAVRQAREGNENAMDVVKLVERINMLIRNGGNELAIADLDLDGDGVLTQRDVALIRQKLGNDKWTDAVFSFLRQQGVTFENQPVSQLEAARNAAGFDAASVTDGTFDSLGIADSRGNERRVSCFFGSLWDAVWSFLVTIWDGIKHVLGSFFCQPPTAETAAKTPEAETAPMIMLPSGLPMQLSDALQR